MKKEKPVDWTRTPDEHRRSKPIEITLDAEDRAFVEKYGGGAGKSGTGKSAVIGAALRLFRKLLPREIIREVEEERLRRRKKTPRDP